MRLPPRLPAAARRTPLGVIQRARRAGLSPKCFIFAIHDKPRPWETGEPANPETSRDAD